MPAVIKEPQTSDHAQIITLWNSARGLPGSHWQQAMLLDSTKLDQLLTSGNHWRIADRPSGMAGLIWWQDLGDIGTILAITSKPGGLSSEKPQDFKDLASVCIAWATDLGRIRTVEVVISSESVGAKALLDQLGFTAEEYGWVPNDPKTAVNFRMRKVVV